MAPKHYVSVLVFPVAENFVQLHREAVQMSNVQRSEVAVERIVDERLINAEVHRRLRLARRLFLRTRLSLR